MYDELIESITYTIPFYDNFFNDFWNGCALLAFSFFSLWGVKLGAGFLRRAFSW